MTDVDEAMIWYQLLDQERERALATFTEAASRVMAADKWLQVRPEGQEELVRVWASALGGVVTIQRVPLFERDFSFSRDLPNLPRGWYRFGERVPRNFTFTPVMTAPGMVTTFVDPAYSPFAVLEAGREVTVYLPER